MDLFDEKKISPMLMNESGPFDDPDYIYELKLDGIRCIAYLEDKKTVLRNKRNKDVTLLYPELKNIFKCTPKKCILDGELILLKKGKPDFYELQKRSLMTNSFRIELSSKQYPVEFVCFDILYFDEREVMDLPLLKRKKLISDKIKEGHGLSISRFIEEEGIAFFKLAKKQKLEGIIAKKKDGKYYLNKRSNEWIKIKVMKDEDLIICGIVLNEENTIKDLVLGFYDEKGILKSRGSVALGISKEDQKIILTYVQKNKIMKPWFEKPAKAIWIKLKLVGACHFMHVTKTGQMRQPVFKGLRNDKSAKECIIKK